MLQTTSYFYADFASFHYNLSAPIYYSDCNLSNLPFYSFFPLSVDLPTNAIVSYLADKISKGFDSGLLTGVFLIDLQKAFNTIDHNILLLKKPSFSRKVNWYKSYLSSRKFHVNVHDKFSTFVNLRCGVPQGSTLGLLLFQLYISDRLQAVDCD